MPFRARGSAQNGTLATFVLGLPGSLLGVAAPKRLYRNRNPTVDELLAAVAPDTTLRP